MNNCHASDTINVESAQALTTWLTAIIMEHSWQRSCWSFRKDWGQQVTSYRQTCHLQQPCFISADVWYVYRRAIWHPNSRISAARIRLSARIKAIPTTDRTDDRAGGLTIEAQHAIAVSGRAVEVKEAMKRSGLDHPTTAPNKGG